MRNTDRRTERLAATLRAVAALSLAAAFATADAAAQEDERQGLPAFRAIWVSRFNWKSPEEIPGIFDRIQAAGVNAVFWQVRGEGLVLYRSAIEPADDRLKTGEDFVDPLALAIREARARNLEIHAWMNCLSGWRGSEPPAQADHLWNRHPEWFATERPQEGRPGEILSPRPILEKEGYTFLNPAMPGVRDHLASLSAELAANYDLDGICYDYVRYKSLRYSYDRFTHRQLPRRSEGRSSKLAPLSPRSGQRADRAPFARDSEGQAGARFVGGGLGRL
jgi:uncharacterized lipoprotein YddW (UPF0748 family)